MTTVNPEEIEKFSRIAAHWWDPQGPFKPLHAINPPRIGYIREMALRHFARTESHGESATPLEGLTLLDVGCGGGLIAEPMRRLGAQVTGLDASENNIAVAALHAQSVGLMIDYRRGEVEALDATFDIVLALEVVEHVADRDAFVRALVQRINPGGLLVMSTINRSVAAYVLAIVAAEYVLRWLPRGTHAWEAFVRPSELCEAVENAGARVVDMTGMTFDPLRFGWTLSARNLAVNYLLTAMR